MGQRKSSNSLQTYFLISTRRGVGSDIHYLGNGSNLLGEKEAHLLFVVLLAQFVALTTSRFKVLSIAQRPVHFIWFSSDWGPAVAGAVGNPHGGHEGARGPFPLDLGSQEPLLFFSSDGKE